jgi:hypothetical protein
MDESRMAADRPTVAMMAGFPPLAAVRAEGLGYA